MRNTQKGNWAPAAFQNCWYKSGFLNDAGNPYNPSTIERMIDATRFILDISSMAKPISRTTGKIEKLLFPVTNGSFIMIQFVCRPLSARKFGRRPIMCWENAANVWTAWIVPEKTQQGLANMPIPIVSYVVTMAAATIVPHLDGRWTECRSGWNTGAAACIRSMAASSAKRRFCINGIWMRSCVNCSLP